MSDRPARIAVLGIELESNALAPPTDRSAFEQRLMIKGQALSRFMREDPSFGFMSRLSGLRPVTPVPILLYQALPGGPCEEALFQSFLAELEAELVASAPIDGVFIFGHGAGTTTICDDLDGRYFEHVRRIVGPEVPIVAELDLHANLSRAMVTSVNAIVGFRTNPHLDIRARSIDCADLMNVLLSAEGLHLSAARLPFISAQVSQLTAPGCPLGDLMATLEAELGGDLLSGSIFPGFALSDTAHNGMAIVAVGRREASAHRLVMMLAAQAWRARSRFEPELVDPAEAVARALRANEPEAQPVILADIADNPGGGGRGNTTDLLKALLDVGVERCQAGLFYDPALCRAAWAVGEGKSFDAVLNAEEDSPLSKQLSARVYVERLLEGPFTNTRGAYAGQAFDPGQACLLKIGGVHLCVASRRLQIFSTDYLRHFGLNPHQAAVFLVKSRGHFRAGFAHLGAEVCEVDLPGLTTARLETVPWSGIRRPIYPIDRETPFALEWLSDG